MHSVKISITLLKVFLDWCNDRQDLQSHKIIKGYKTILAILQMLKCILIAHNLIRSCDSGVVEKGLLAGPDDRSTEVSQSHVN